jgi:hypothetical protein
VVFVWRLTLLCDPRADNLLVVLSAARPIGGLLGRVVTTRNRRRISLLDTAALDLLDRVVTASFGCLGASFSGLGVAGSYACSSDAETVVGALGLTGIRTILNGLAANSLLVIRL